MKNNNDKKRSTQTKGYEIYKKKRVDKKGRTTEGAYERKTERPAESIRKPVPDRYMEAPVVPAREDLVEGRNAVIETLKGDTTIENIMVAKGDTKGSISVVLALAKEKGIVVKEVERKMLDLLSPDGAHQGVIAKITPFNYCSIEEILKFAKTRNEEPFILVLDEIEDPHNFGAIIRTAEVCGVHGIIIPKRRSVGVTSAVYKASAGAAVHMKIAKVTNLNAAIDELKKNEIWIYGADMDGKRYCFETNFNSSLALVIGSEGKGISKLTKEKCDLLVKIPMMGQINSLNASVAGGILMYEIIKQKISSVKK
jgi:23S rRNA (guanosine2251-2'-O)-methyltransferase